MSRCITKTDLEKPPPTGHTSMRGCQQPLAPRPTGHATALHFPAAKQHLPAWDERSNNVEACEPVGIGSNPTSSAYLLCDLEQVTSLCSACFPIGNMGG